MTEVDVDDIECDATEYIRNKNLAGEIILDSSGLVDTEFRIYDGDKIKETR